MGVFGVWVCMVVLFGAFKSLAASVGVDGVVYRTRLVD